jgi:uncharacterized BrkB/YihY/UPF0761 family membrane protein
MFKHKSWFQRNNKVIGAGAQIFSFFILEVVVTILVTIGGALHSSNDEIDERRSEIWRAYKEKRPVDLE